MIATISARGLYMTRNLIFAAILCLPVQAQFNSMVTTDDGSTVLFQSAWRMAGSNDGPLQKIFRLDSRGFSVVFSPPDPGLIVSPLATDSAISGDGKIFGYTTFAGCSGTGCGVPRVSLTVSGASLPAGLPQLYPFQISRNGRFLSAGMMVADRTTGSIVNLASITAMAQAGAAFGGRFGISDNGGLLLLAIHSVFPVGSSEDLFLSTKPDVKIVNAPIIYAAVVDAGEHRVVYEIQSPSGQQLWSYEVASGQATMLEQSNAGTSAGVTQFQPSISNDGSRLLYRRVNPNASALEAVVHDYSADATIVLGPIPSGANNFVITGDGKSAWLHRTDGRLVQVSVDGSVIRAVPGRHVWIEQKDGASVYGSFNHLFGGGFALDDSTAPPTDLSIDLAGLTVPILAATPRELDVQIPWEAPPTGHFQLTLRSSSSMFESILPFDMTFPTPTFERTGIPGTLNRTIIAAHDDFHGLVTPADPAVSGENLHLYMTGLGDVQPRPRTGSPPDIVTSNASTRPLCWLTTFGGFQEAVPVYFAGLAPTLIGIYQVDIAIPADFSSSFPTLNCFDQDGQFGIHGDYGAIPIVKR